MNIKLAELLSNNGGKLPRYVTDELYPVYYTTTQHVILCPACANLILGNSNIFGGQIKADDLEDCKINWDNYDLVCERGHKIESATLDLDKIGEIINGNTRKRQVQTKGRQLKLHSIREQTSTRH